ncbi:MAG: PEP-CTERM sorting domain-containing protein, partial [Gammaproteobacteria bacterium]
GYWPEFSDDWLPIEQTAFGQSLAFWRIAYSGDVTTGNVATQFLGQGGAPALWSLANDGTLTFATVPEAETWALLGLGLLGAGAVARRRSRALA